MCERQVCLGLADVNR